jgi:hypothetical protein
MRATEFIAETPVRDLTRALKANSNHDYNTIGGEMTAIALHYDITTKQLHDRFVKRYGKTPDEWIKSQSVDEAGTGLTWRGYPCTQDCSGHQAGDSWAQARGIKDPNSCPPGNSNSWWEGCRSEAQGKPI